ncbi:MAG: hypothetical protein QW294_02320 [Candidatus Bathyarchaeia archaeon]
MNVKWVVLVLIALLAGFGGGFISSYLVFQQQIANLRMEIKELQEQLSDLGTIYSNISTLIGAQNELISGLQEQVANLETLSSNISALPEIRNELNKLESILLNIVSLLQQLLSKEYAKIEKLEFLVAYAEKAISEFSVVLKIKNTGSSDAMIQMILLNGRLDGSARVNGTSLSNTYLGIPVKVGQITSLIITLPAGTYTSGQTIEIMVQTTVGNQYPKTIVLP